MVSTLHADGLPPFYAALLKAWKALNGLLSLNGSLANNFDHQVPSFSCKSCNQMSLVINPSQPYCVDKFTPSFRKSWLTVNRQPSNHLSEILTGRQPGSHCWSCPWTGNSSISIGNLHMGSCIPPNGYLLSPTTFLLIVSAHITWNLLRTFPCLVHLSKLTMTSCDLCSSPLGPSITVRHMIFGFSGDG